MSPRDSLDLPSLRDGSRRAIPWDAPIPALDPARRARLLHAWSWRREQEHLAVGAFCRIAFEAAAYGCEPATLALFTRAATDEVHHADVCRRMVEKHGGESLATTLKLASVPAALAVRTADDLLLSIVETSCLSETFTGAYFTDMLEIATEPLARAVLLSLLEDEIDHGRVGWAYLASACRDGRGAVVEAALPNLVERTMAEVLDDAARAPEGDDPELDRHGYMGRTRGARVYRDALAQIVLPGFEALGIDTSPARAHAHSRGFLA